ncbi:MAG: VWA domain-containing protein [Gammaproteobacteria bacterium]|nr:VWA domain-containing protein [Gammaproteobacteria bacterium]MYF31690.1 VWA domain-containing protein [Gammaproteobacteria bacterium]
MKGALRTCRVLVAGVVAMLAVPAASMFDVSVAGAQASSEPGASGYTPCAAGQQDIDLLVMMDASGSLNAPASGIDSDGRLRRTALQRFREELTSLLQRLPPADAGSVRIALWRFESDVTRIAGFGRATDSHPSNAQIEASLGEPLGDGRYSYRTNHTDYLQALSAAERAFLDEGTPGACRVLLFFSDGLYDPTGTPTLEQADELRDAVCRDLKLSYERAGINTFSILLGQAFRGVTGGFEPGGADEVDAEMAEASKQILRALTGHADSPLVRGLPYSRRFDCERWSDVQPDDRDGSIIAVDDLDSLAIQLLEVAETAARQLVEWRDCGISTGSGGRSGALPAGRYIETIVAYPRGSLIEEYEIVTAEGQTIRGPGDLDRPLYLDSDVLHDLEAGWTLEFLTDGGSGAIEVACYARRATPPSADVQGTVTDRDERPLPDVVRSAGGADSPPLDGVRIVAEAPPGLCEQGPEVWPDERVRDWYCRSDGTVVFELHPLECQQSYDLDRPLVYRFEPAHADGLFGPGEVSQQVRIEVAGSTRRLYDCLGAPLLTCADDTAATATDVPALVIEPDSHELPRTPLLGVTACRLYPPEDGVAILRARWRPDASIEDLPGELDWRFDGGHYGSEFEGVLDESGRELRLGPGGSPEGVVLRFVTTDELANADWRIAGVIELVPMWQTGVADPDVNAIAGVQMAAQRTAVRADASYAARSDSGVARWLTLIVLLASLLLSYVLFCLALASTFGLADPRRFWWRHAVLGVERRTGTSHSFVSGAVPSLAAAPAEAIGSERAGSSRRPRYTGWRGPAQQQGADGISVVLRRSPRFWLFGLLRGPWSEVRSDGRAVAVQPKGRKRSRKLARAASRAEFERLIVVGAPRRDSNGALSAPAWVAHPRSGRFSSSEQIDERELAGLLNEAAEQGDSDIGPDADLGSGSDTEPDAGEARSSSSGDRPPPRRRGPE